MEQTPGEKLLIYKLERLLEEAKAGEFGDFTSHRYPAPKTELRNRFLQLANEVVAGIFD